MRKRTLLSYFDKIEENYYEDQWIKLSTDIIDEMWNAIQRCLPQDEVAFAKKIARKNMNDYEGWKLITIYSLVDYRIKKNMEQNLNFVDSL